MPSKSDDLQRKGGLQGGQLSAAAALQAGETA
jgi:hypothetical protein